MKRPVGTKPAREIMITAAETRCVECGEALKVCQHRERWIERLDGYLHVTRRDKKCPIPECPGAVQIFHPPEDLRLAMPYRSYGLDVTLAIGERHLRGESLGSVQRDLNARGILIDQRHTGRVFRDFLALTNLALGDDASRRERLRAQGGIVLMCDGVQFDDSAPVTYLAWDAMSGTPLFSERRSFRSEEDLRPILERVKAMDVPVVAIVSDKEKGLVPAVEAVFPDAPYQFCQTHFLKNCAKPLQDDLSALGASVTRRATRVHRIAKRLHETEPPAQSDAPSVESGSSSEPKSASESRVATLPESAAPPPMPDAEFAKDLCQLVRQNARMSGKAPLDPPELKRHERLETLRELVSEDARKKGARRRSSKRSRKRSRPTGTRSGLRVE